MTAIAFILILASLIGIFFASGLVICENYADTEDIIAFTCFIIILVCGILLALINGGYIIIK